MEQVGNTDSVDLTRREYQDYDGPLVPVHARFAFSRLATAKSLRGIAALMVSIVVIATPATSPRALATLLAVLLLVWAVGALAELREDSLRSWLLVARAAVLIGAAVGLLLAPGLTFDRLAQLVGIGLLVLGLLTGVRASLTDAGGVRTDHVLSAVIYVLLGGALLVSPGTILGLIVVVLAIYWFLVGLATVVVNIQVHHRQITPSHTWRMFLEWVQTRPNTVDDRNQLYQKLFYEGTEAARRLSRFFMLMGFATTIAAWGIIADSTAVVIGAMLVAPLMRPLMGTSLSMVMGWSRRALMSGSVAVLGMLFAIGLSIVYGWMYGTTISPELNSEVASRIGPTLVDLVIAVAAGGAGAFALSRPDVSDSLTGVAVSVALVPPLSVVGLMISQEDFDAASGALLLFSTNLVAILLVGGLVFVLTGVVPVLQLWRNSQWITRALGMVAAAAVAIIALLGLNLQTLQRQATGIETVRNLADDWLTDTDLTVTDTTYSDGEYALVVEGPDQPPSIDDLAAEVESALGDEVGVSVTWIPTQSYEYKPAR